MTNAREVLSRHLGVQWHEEEKIVAAMKEYTKAAIDSAIFNRHLYLATWDKGEIYIDHDALEKFKEQLV